MRLPVIQVDAFTSVPFAGNPAAVCLLRRARDDRWMQLVAREMNLSETAFVVASSSRGEADFDLRWFTPTTEVDLCGHATLATAHVLWERGVIDHGVTLRFHTRSGVLTARRCGDWIELDFPATPPEPATVEELPAALGVVVRYVGRSRHDILVEVASAEVVKALRPDLGRLRELDARGVIVTSLSDDSRFDFVSRFFAPGSGVDEDPVTGSAHCCLAPYWSEKLARTKLVARQLSARGGTVRVAMAGDRVRLSGQAVTVLEGELIG